MKVHRIQIILFFISIFAYLFYYISAYFTQTLAPFFVWAGTGGMDFFQIPNGAYAFLHGGSLTGSLPPGVSAYSLGYCCGVNLNVYHPFFTLLVGAPLQYVPPKLAMFAWAIVHLIVMAILIYFLWKKFRYHKYLYLGLSILLLFSYQYYEIWLDQYHFLFNFFTILFLYESVQNGDTEKAGIWLFLSLLIKPIGLLWIIPLLLYKRYKTVVVGLGFFVFATCIFLVAPFDIGRYYIKNFFSIATGTTVSANIYALKWFVPWFSPHMLKVISILLGIGLLLLQIVKKPKLFTVVMLWIGYQLLFYGLVFHYHYTILAGIICLGILFDIFSPKSFSIVPIIFLTLPAPVVLLNLSVRGVARSQLAIIWLYSIFWLCCLLGHVLIGILRGNKNFIKDYVGQ